MFRRQNPKVQFCDLPVLTLDLTQVKSGNTWDLPWACKTMSWSHISGWTKYQKKRPFIMIPRLLLLTFYLDSSQPHDEYWNWVPTRRNSTEINRYCSFSISEEMWKLFQFILAQLQTLKTFRQRMWLKLGLGRDDTNETQAVPEHAELANRI